MENLLADLSYASRLFIKNTGLTSVVLITLDLGIGANTTIFSLVNGVLLRPLPSKDSERLVAVWQSNTRAGVQRRLAATPNFEDWWDIPDAQDIP